jgi:hypothetical protein
MGDKQSLLSDPDEDHVFFTMIQNCLIDLPISPIAFRVYVYIKRRTGDSVEGKCWESSRNIAKACVISTGALSKAKAELQYFGLIDVKKVSTGRDRFPHDEITVVNLWKVNKDYYLAGNADKQKWIKTIREDFIFWRDRKGWRVPDEKRKKSKGTPRN